MGMRRAPFLFYSSQKLDEGGNTELMYESLWPNALLAYGEEYEFFVGLLLFTCIRLTNNFIGICIGTHHDT